MKLNKKYVYLIDYSFENFQKYNEEYFNKKGINAKVFLLLNSLDSLVDSNIYTNIFSNTSPESTPMRHLKGGNNNNMSLTIPYKYFDQLIQYISKLKVTKKNDEKVKHETPSSTSEFSASIASLTPLSLQTTKATKDDEKDDAKKRNIFMEGIDKIKIMLNYADEKRKESIKESNEQALKKEPIVKNADNDTIMSIFESRPFKDDVDSQMKPKRENQESNMKELTQEQKRMIFEEGTGDNKKLLKIESDKPIFELEEENQEEILEENILENTREYKILYRS